MTQDTHDALPEEDIGTNANFDALSQSVGPRIRMARDAKQMSQEALAMKLGVKNTTLSAWEDGIREPRVNRLQMVAGLLDVSIVWLISGIDNGTHHVRQSHDSSYQKPPSSSELRELRKLLESALQRIEAMENRQA